LARGYLNRPELTAEKFVRNPFSEESGSRMYRTGDLCRWLEDGNIEYLGRIDEQVKIRGYRVEPGEIESVLEQSGLVRQAAVVLREDGVRGKKLVGYVVGKEGYDRSAAMAWLRSRLPEYMVPWQLVELEAMPLTGNGKVDRRALPEVDGVDAESGSAYVGPRNEVERVLAGIWEELLGIEQVGMNDNFFELGGDSIITIQLVSRARRDGYALQVGDVFLHQTVGKLSASMAERSSAPAHGEQGMLEGGSGLAPIQAWYLGSGAEELSHFNQSVLLGIDKGIEGVWLEGSVRELLRHHDGLRFVYRRVADGWEQAHGSYEGRLDREDLREVEEDALGAEIERRSNVYQRSLDIEKGELVRVVWMQTPAAERYDRLLVVIHHLVVDGVSWRILLEDLELLIKGFREQGRAEPGRVDHGVALGRKGSSYREWGVKLAEYGRSRRLQGQREYWAKIVGSYRPLWVDREEAGEVRMGELGSYVVRLGGEQTQRLLQEVPRVYHTEINDVLLCALGMTICGWQGRDRMTIGLEGHGREEGLFEGVDVSRTVGWFTSLYPVLLEVGSSSGSGALLKGVKEQLRGIPDKGLGYGVLRYMGREAGSGERDGWMEQEGWDITFNYLGQLDNIVNRSEWLRGVGGSAGDNVSEGYRVREKLLINGAVQGGELVLHWRYSRKHYEEETMRALGESYRRNLEELIGHCVEQGRIGEVYTPSDYGLGREISNRELDRFLNEGSEMDNIIEF